MAKIQFNCRLEKSVIEWIDAEAASQSKTLGRKFSQADVVTMLVGSAAVMAPTPRKLSKKERLAEERKAADPLAQNLGPEDIDYMNPDELPSAGSVGVEVLNAHSHNVKAGDRLTVTNATDWRAGRKPLMKPKDTKR